MTASGTQKDAGELLEDAADTVTQDRDTHGEAVENHEHIADFWTTLFEGKLKEGEEIEAHEVADAMVLVKLSRRYTGELTRDHRKDIAGYTGIAWACEMFDAPEVKEALEALDDVEGDTQEERFEKARKSVQGGGVMGETVYLAGPVAQADDNGSGWRDYLKQEFPDFDYLDPLDKYDGGADDVHIVNSEEEIPANPTDEYVTAHEIVRSDKEMVEASDYVLVGWEEVVSIGTPMEVMYAKSIYRGPEVVIWNRYDNDLSPWFVAHADFMSKDEEAALAYINGMKTKS